jgi:hypothetical protein
MTALTVKTLFDLDNAQQYGVLMDVAPVKAGTFASGVAALMLTVY